MKKSLHAYAVMAITSILVFGALAPVQSAHAGICGNVEVQISIVLDGSGSINSGEFTTMINGIKNAIDSTVPIDGTIEISVIQFGSQTPLPTANMIVNVEVPSVLVTSQAVKDQLLTDIMAISQIGGATPLNLGIDTAVTEISSSSSAGCGVGLINIVTDGVPNNSQQANNLAQSLQFAENSATAAMNNANIDGLSGFGVGIGDPALENLRAGVVFPQPGVIITPPEVVPNPINKGFIVDVATFTDFAPAFLEKLQQEVFQMMIGGEILSIDTTALLIAGINTNSYSILGVLTMLGAAAFGAVYYTSKKRN